MPSCDESSFTYKTANILGNFILYLEYFLDLVQPICIDDDMTFRHGVKYIEMYLNTNTLVGFKYKYI